MHARILRLVKPGDALMTVAISRRQYSLGISCSKHTESSHKFLKFPRGGNADCGISETKLSLILTIKVSSDGRDESAPAVEIR
jgi:hypothetical protein